MARIYQTLLDSINRNIPGVLADWDTEFLHDLRVAVRRTRSGLSLVKKVLPGEIVARFKRDFGLLGFDNNPRFRACNLTTVAPPIESVGRILARVLSGNLLPIDQFSSVVLRVASRVIARATCRMTTNTDRPKGRPQQGGRS